MLSGNVEFMLLTHRNTVTGTDSRKVMKGM